MVTEIWAISELGDTPHQLYSCLTQQVGFSGPSRVNSYELTMYFHSLQGPAVILALGVWMQTLSLKS